MGLKEAIGEWKAKKLFEVCKMKSGNTITAHSINTSHKYPCYGGNGLRGYTDRFTHEGDFALIGRQGALCGNVQFASGNFFASEHAVVVTPRKGIDIKWLFFVLGKMNLNQYAESSAQPGLTVSKILSLPILVPPTIHEQRAIANAISDINILIASLEKIISKKRSIKEGAMQKLLQPKKGWKELRLGDVAVLKARIGWQGLTTNEYKTSGDYNLITGTEFKNGYIDFDKCYFVEYNRYKQDKYIQVKNDDILVTKDGTIGKVAYIKSLPRPATLNSGVFVIRPIDHSFTPAFLFHLLMSKHFKQFLSQLAAGSTISHLYQKDFVHFRFQVPKTHDEQIEISSILSDMDNEISMLENKMRKYEQIKEGMMQNLLTGKIRLIKKEEPHAMPA